MAGGMGRREGPTLAERIGALVAPAEEPGELERRHCWVHGLTDAPGRWPGLLVEWRHVAAGWQGRVAYVRGGGPDPVVLVEAWLAADHLEPRP